MELGSPASRKLKLVLVMGLMLTFPELVAIFRSQLLAEICFVCPTLYDPDVLVSP